MEAPDLGGPVRARARVCECVCVRVSAGARARGFPTAAGVSEAGPAQRDVCAARGPLPPSPSAPQADAQPEWKRSFGGRGALCRKLTHHDSLPQSGLCPRAAHRARSPGHPRPLLALARIASRFPADGRGPAGTAAASPGLHPGRPPAHQPIKEHPSASTVWTELFQFAWRLQ